MSTSTFVIVCLIKVIYNLKKDELFPWPKVKSILGLHCLSAYVVALMLVLFTSPVLELVAHYTIVIITLSVQANFDICKVFCVYCTCNRSLASA